MPTFDSDQIAKLDLAPTASPLNTDELLGRVRIARFSHTIPTGGYAANDVLELIDLPKDARVIGGRVVFSAIGAGRTMDIGTAADVDRYLDGADVSAAGGADLANTIVLNFHEKLTAKTRVQATLLGDTFPAAAVINGHFLFVTD